MRRITSQARGSLAASPSDTAPQPISFARLAGAGPFALAAFAVAICAAYAFPVIPLVLIAALLVYAAILWREPCLWLFFVPALIPVLNLAPWSGRFFFDELDLFLLTTVAVWLLRGHLGKSTRMAPVASLAIGLFVIVFLVSLLIGISPLEPLDANSFANYYSKYNGLRVGKSLGWAIVFIVLLRAELGRDRKALTSYWVPGILAGLAGVVCVALWERVAFPGLTNFSEEYRVTSTFGSMHVGGGAIDGYLALALPFTLVWLSETKSMVKVAAAAAILALGSYTILTTFSRGLYGACVVMVVALAFGAMLRQKATGAFSASRAIAVVLTILILSGLCFGVFAWGGYRSLAAVLGLLALAFFCGRKGEIRDGGSMGIVLALALIAVNLVFVKLFDKGVYIAYAMSFLIGAMGVMLSLLRPHTAKQRLSFAGFLATAAATPLVANHWGGTSGLWVSLATVLIVLVLVFLNRSIKRPLWTPNIRHAAILAFVSMIFFLSVPIAGNSYFVSERFSDKSGAVRDRMSHWQDALNMMDAAPLAQLFGMGVGRFPALYFWRSSRTSPPGTFTLMDEFGNGFLRLGGTRDDLGGVVLYYAQRIRPEPYRTLIFSFDVRSTFKNASIQVGLCESLLLYTENCETKSARLTKTDGSWQRMDFPLTTRTLGAWHKYGKRPVQAWLVNPVGATHVDIDNVRLTDTAGTNLLKNGDFSEGGDHWLFSVSNFWPWHIESIWVHTVFEQGWVGLAVLLVLILYAVGRLLLLIRQGQLVALALFVSFAGFLTVGTFNSLFEFPRVALLFYLALFIALTRWGDDSAAIRRARDERGLDRETPV